MALDSNSQLIIENLSVIRSDLPLFDPVNLTLNNGDAIQISGTNGSGKTSLLRCICGLSHRHEGVISWCGDNINEHSEAFYQQLLYIGHSLGLKTKLTVQQNLEFYQQLRFQSDPSSIKTALEQLHIASYHDELVGNLSAGQKRRVALARIICEPVKLWLLDEPMVALDIDGQSWLENVCNRHLEQDGMILLTSHQEITGIKALSQYRLQEPAFYHSAEQDEPPVVKVSR